MVIKILIFRFKKNNGGYTRIELQSCAELAFFCVLNCRVKYNHSICSIYAYFKEGVRLQIA